MAAYMTVGEQKAIPRHSVGRAWSRDEVVMIVGDSPSRRPLRTQAGIYCLFTNSTASEMNLKASVLAGTPLFGTVLIVPPWEEIEGVE